MHGVFEYKQINKRFFFPSNAVADKRTKSACQIFFTSSDYSIFCLSLLYIHWWFWQWKQTSWPMYAGLSTSLMMSLARAARTNWICIKTLYPEPLFVITLHEYLRFLIRVFTTYLYFYYATIGLLELMRGSKNVWHHFSAQGTPLNFSYSLKILSFECITRMQNS